MNYSRYLTTSGVLCSLLLVFTPSNVWSQASPPAKLIALWDFDDSSDTAKTKDKLHAIPGLIQGGAVFTADAGGRSGKAGDRGMDFGTTGTKSVAVNAAFLNALLANDQVTIAFWQKNYTVVDSSSFWAMSPSSNNGERGIQAHVPWSNQNIYFDSAGCCNADQRISGPIDTFANYDPDGDGTPNFRWTDWHHYAFVKDGVRKEVWIDGVKFLEGDQASPLPTDLTTLFIGAGSGGGSTVRAILDDFAIFVSPLDESQINRLAKGESPTAQLLDTDNDGIPDWWEEQFGLNKNVNDAAGDLDNDGLTNLREYQKLTDTRNADTDGDGLKDGAETGTGVYVSATDTGTDPVNPDSDGDGLADNIENNSGVFVNAANPGTNPNIADTDGDGFSDGFEAKFSGNPVDKNNAPYKPGKVNLLAYWDFNTADPEKSLDKVFGAQGELLNGALITEDALGRTLKGGDRALDVSSGGYLRVTDPSFLDVAGAVNKMTVSFWQNLNDVANTSALWTTGAGQDRAFQAHTPWGNHTVYFDTGGGCCNGTQRIEKSLLNGGFPGYDENYLIESWHHFVFVKDGDLKQIWLDGKLFLQGSGTAALPKRFLTMAVGSAANGGGFLHGKLDDFAVFASGLTEAQIQALYSGTAPDKLETDSDNDGAPDIWEDLYGFNKNSAADGAQDADGDGLTNVQEFQRGTNPKLPDTDADGLNDKAESNTGIFVDGNDTGTNPLKADTDGDSLVDSVESNTGTFVSATNTGTNPLKSDTDGDAYSDGVEVRYKSNPNVSSDIPYKPGQPNLLAFWDFNNANNPLESVDRAFGNVGLLLNAVYTDDALGRTLKAGDRALDLGMTTANQYMRAVDPSFLDIAGSVDQMTVSFWQNLYEVANTSSFWADGVGQNRAYQAHVPWGNQNIYFDTGGGTDPALHRINRSLSEYPDYHDAYLLDSWHHFVFIKRGARKEVWLDGKLFMEGTNTAALPKAFTALGIGSDAGGGGSIRGKIDDFAIFASGLTAGQVVKLFEGTSPAEIVSDFPLISIAKGPTGLSITFTGTLESSDTALPGSWTAVQNATSPYPITNPTGKRFYRSRK